MVKLSYQFRYYTNIDKNKINDTIIDKYPRTTNYYKKQKKKECKKCKML